MANAQYRRNSAEGSDYISFNDGGTLVKFRVRPSEVVEVDLADADQDAAFDQSKYTLLGSTSYSHKVKPSA